MIMTWCKIVSSIILTVVLTACISRTNQPPFDETLWLDQGWSASERQTFHYLSQGSSTFPVPYDWFLALERPQGLRDLLLRRPGEPFADANYLRRFGFIPSEGNYLPIGFTKSRGLDGTENIGLTCAACHTGQLTYDRKKLLIDGGPGLINIDSFGTALVEALAETLEPARLDRFGKAIYGDDYPTGSEKAELTRALEGIIASLAKSAAFGVLDRNPVTAGFGRLDALNAIGNTVFNTYAGKGLLDFENMAHTNAPVNFPHLWTTSWFDWVQYDASIMQPMVRNAGEALGVGAQTVLLPGSALAQYSSAAELENLHQLETLLAGEHPLENQRFTGLLAPQWPQDLLGELDSEKLEAGKLLYREHCRGCHGPSIADDDSFWSDNNWQAIPANWFEGSAEQTNKKYYRVRILPLAEIGTDSAQADVLAKRTLDLTGFDLTGDVCLINQDGIKQTVAIKSEPGQSFALALGLVVQRIEERYYRDHGIDRERQNAMNGERPNCLQADRGYKARPLNGIWATAPFLHNGSVPNLYEMLLPLAQRSPLVYLGYQGFDPERVGYLSTKGRGGLNDAMAAGLTRVVVGGSDAKHGNRNSGHEFSDDGGSGVIGQAFSDAERWQLVEYLKSL